MMAAHGGDGQGILVGQQLLVAEDSEGLI